MNWPAVAKEKILQIFTPRKIRQFRESLTGYLFVTPALILIFTFGIFPVAFALFVSLHKWRIVRTDFVGLDNYVRAIGNLAYVAGFFIGVGALVGVYILLKRIVRKAQEVEQKPWLLAIPGFMYAWSVFYFLRYIWFQLPEFLDIAKKILGVEKTRELFNQLIKEAFYAPAVYQAWYYFTVVLFAAIVIGIVALILYKKPQGSNFISQFALIWISLGSGLGLLYFTYQEIAGAYQTALETNTDPGIWHQVITISAGIILFMAGWICWNSASKRDTIFYSVGTVPLQLTLSLFLAILLFQKLRGSELFRMLFFLPYVTPFIASAAIFRQLFANRDTSPINLLLRGLGGNALAWLQESKGVNLILAESIGLNIPDWAVGPSLALVVVMIHSVWTYVGYDIVIYLAGLGNIPTELNDAAAIDGASKWEVFRYITFPLLSPTTYFLSLVAIIGTFKAFATLWVFREGLTLGTTDTLSVAIFLEFFEKLRYGYASALAFVLFAIILGLTVINNKFQGSKVFYL